MSSWNCPNGHKLGEVQRINHLSRLMVYAAPLPTEQAHLIAIITGSADVVCSVCGEVRHWQMESTLMDSLLLGEVLY